MQALKNRNILDVFNVLAYTTRDLNKIYQIDGKEQTILHYASTYSSKEIVELLLRNGCSIDTKDEEGFKPLDRAMIANNVKFSQVHCLTWNRLKLFRY